MSRRRRLLCWSLAAALCVVPVIMFSLIYALGPRGTCEADLNNTAIFLAWFASTAAAGLIVIPLFLVGGRDIVPRPASRYTLVLPLALGVAAAIYLLGLIPLLTYTTCAE